MTFDKKYVNSILEKKSKTTFYILLCIHMATNSNNHVSHNQDTNLETTLVQPSQQVHTFHTVERSTDLTKSMAEKNSPLQPDAEKLSLAILSKTSENIEPTEEFAQKQIDILSKSEVTLEEMTGMQEAIKKIKLLVDSWVQNINSAVEKILAPFMHSKRTKLLIPILATLLYFWVPKAFVNYIESWKFEISETVMAQTNTQNTVGNLNQYVPPLLAQLVSWDSSRQVLAPGWQLEKVAEFAKLYYFRVKNGVPEFPWQTPPDIKTWTIDTIWVSPLLSEYSIKMTGSPLWDKATWFLVMDKEFETMLNSIGYISQKWFIENKIKEPWFDYKIFLSDQRRRFQSFVIAIQTQEENLRKAKENESESLSKKNNNDWNPVWKKKRQEEYDEAVKNRKKVENDLKIARQRATPSFFVMNDNLLEIDPNNKVTKNAWWYNPTIHSWVEVDVSHWWLVSIYLKRRNAAPVTVTPPSWAEGQVINILDGLANWSITTASLPWELASLVWVPSDSKNIPVKINMPSWYQPMSLKIWDLDKNAYARLWALKVKEVKTFNVWWIDKVLLVELEAKDPVLLNHITWIVWVIDIMGSNWNFNTKANKAKQLAANFGLPGDFAIFDNNWNIIQLQQLQNSSSFDWKNVRIQFLDVGSKNALLEQGTNDVLQIVAQTNSNGNGNQTNSRTNPNGNGNWSGNWTRTNPNNNTNNNTPNTNTNTTNTNSNSNALKIKTLQNNVNTILQEMKKTTNESRTNTLANQMQSLSSLPVYINGQARWVFWSFETPLGNLKNTTAIITTKWGQLVLWITLKR